MRSKSVNELARDELGNEVLSAASRAEEPRAGAARRIAGLPVAAFACLAAAIACSGALLLILQSKLTIQVDELRPGVRTLFRDADRVPPRRLSDRPEPRRRGAARIPRYLARATAEGKPYRIYGYKGKQVRDNLHSYDVCRAIMAFAERPRAGAVYNLGGGRANSVSLLEAVARFEELLGKRLATEYVEEPRAGDHIVYITDLRRFRSDYPEWDVTISLEEIFRDLAKVQLAPL